MLQTSLCRPAESPHGRQVSKDRTDVTQLKHNPRSHFVPSAELQKDYNCQALGKDSSWPRPWLLPPRLHRPRQFCAGRIPAGVAGIVAASRTNPNFFVSMYCWTFGNLLPARWREGLEDCPAASGRQRLRSIVACGSPVANLCTRRSALGRCTQIRWVMDS